MIITITSHTSTRYMGIDKVHINSNDYHNDDFIKYYLTYRLIRNIINKMSGI